MPDPTVEVSFSPALLKTVPKRDSLNVVVVDILRATTAMCTAFGYGLHSLIPADHEEQALEMKKKGWLVAGEKDGIKLSFADFGNSPLEFRSPLISGKDIVYCTTNGTRAINLAKAYGQLLIASFVNLEAVAGFLNRDQKDVVILCAGWKDEFSLEDAIFAGAMADLLVNAYGFLPESDATIASMSLYEQSTTNIMKTVSRSSHYLRLLGIENRKGLEYCFFPDKFHVIPVLEGDWILDYALLSS
jgi:2-phosphosulfolactate phosphatase